jgi:hypothetical protein
LKLLVTSVDALINSESGQFFPGIIKELTAYLALSPDNKVTVISVNSNRLQKIPNEFNPLKIPYELRGKGIELFDCKSSA